MKNLFKLLLIVFCFVVVSCSSDDNSAGCTTIYSGRMDKDGSEYFVYYYNTANGGKEESVQVPEEIYTWILRGNLNSGDCFDVEKYKFVK